MALVKFRIYYIKEKENAKVDTLNKRLNYIEGIELKEYRIFKMIEITLIYVKLQVNRIKEVNYICNIRCLYDKKENRDILKEVHETKGTTHIEEEEMYEYIKALYDHINKLKPRIKQKIL